MEEKYAAIRRAGLGLAAISYDSPEVLKNFADRQHIEFPLLSDSGSAIIRKFGIFNVDVKKGSSTYGIPYPGIYLLDSAGVIKAKFFEGDFRERDTAGMILLQQFGIHPETTSATVPAKHVQLSVASTEENPRVGQHLSLILTVKVPADEHVYAPGVQGYIPIDWRVEDNAAVKAGPVNYPASKLMRMEAIRETVPVYEGEIELVRSVTLGNQKDLTPLLDSGGNLNVIGNFRYQACDRKECFLPETVPVNITLHIRQVDRTRVPESMQRKAGS